MKINVRVIEDRMQGGSLQVELADVPCGPVDHVNQSVEVRSLWLPEGSRLYETAAGEKAVQTPDCTIGMSLGDALARFGKYSA